MAGKESIVLFPELASQRLAGADSPEFYIGILMLS